MGVLCPDIGQLLCQVMLQPMLASEDRPLGASLLEQSPLDEQLRMISGQKGAPQIHPWEGGMGAWGVEMTVGKNKISSDMSSVQSAFPQHKNLGLSLLEMQLKILGHLLWRVASKKKIHLLEVSGVKLLITYASTLSSFISFRRLTVDRLHKEQYGSVCMF